MLCISTVRSNINGWDHLIVISSAFNLRRLIINGRPRYTTTWNCVIFQQHQIQIP
jgi:hypothetical protein